MTYQLSAPRSSGYETTTESREAARREAAEILGVPMEAMIEVGPVGGDDVTYCYPSQEDADADSDGSYAVQFKPVYEASRD